MEQLQSELTEPDESEPACAPRSTVVEMLEGVEDLTTVWVGGIPEHHPAMDETVLEEFFDSRFGAVDSLNLRIKAGTDRSWCLISFAEEAAATKLLEEGANLGDAVGGAPGASCRVQVDRADILTHLRKPNPGALASIWEKMENKKCDIRERRRMALHRPSYYDSPEFQKWVDKFWDLLKAEGGASKSPSRLANEDTITYANYESLHLRISKTLHTHFSRIIARKVATQDWASDTEATTTTMTRAEFEKSLGELGELWAGEVIGREGGTDADVWRSMDPTDVMVKFLAVLYENCTEVHVNSERQKQRMLKKRLLKVRYINLKGLSDMMGDAELGKEIDATSNTRAASRMSSRGSTRPLRVPSRISVQDSHRTLADGAPSPEEHVIASQGKSPSPMLSCGCGPGLLLQYHCARCAYRTQVAEKRQAEERRQRELKLRIRVLGDPVHMLSDEETGGLDAQQSKISVGTNLAQLSRERSCSSVKDGIPSNCHKQGGIVRSGGGSQPGALAGVTPYAPGTALVDDPLILGSSSQEVLRQLEVVAGGPNIRPVPPNHAKRHIQSHLAATTVTACAESNGSELVAQLMRNSKRQQSLTSLQSLDMNAMATHTVETGWLPPYGMIQQRRPCSPKLPYTPRIGAGVVASRISLVRLSAPRAAAHDAGHAPSPTLKATVTARGPSRTLAIGASFSECGPMAGTYSSQFILPACLPVCQPAIGLLPACLRVCLSVFLSLCHLNVPRSRQWCK